MSRPNFFIVGAPKCGTTALADYLRAHPQVFVSDPKEPNYFARHLSTQTGPPDATNSLDRYLELFDAPGNEVRAIGEASTRYLRSEQALREIAAFAPDARIIAMLRNPVDLVPSWHAQKLYECEETEQELERAWKLQEPRRRGESLPSEIRARDSLFYGEVASLGRQVETLLEVFPRERVHLIFFDDFTTDSRRTYTEVLAFLDVPDDGRTAFETVNPRRAQRFPALARALKRPPAPVRALVEGLRRGLGIRSFGVTRALDQLSVPDAAPQIAPEFRRELCGYFADDIERLSRVTGRDLSDWLRA